MLCYESHLSIDNRVATTPRGYNYLIDILKRSVLNITIVLEDIVVNRATVRITSIKFFENYRRVLEQV